MVLVGGITRLTGSGLSITEWKVVTGVVPPLTSGDWDELFALYRQSPQYLAENAHFGLGDFQRIFWWEWAHRLLGRVVGLTYLLPFLWFWWKKALDGWLVRRGLMLFGLVAFQGALGWVMVKSGLVDRPQVSHYRLAAHLVTALFTLALTQWTALRCGLPRTVRARTPATSAWLFLGLLTLQVVLGAFVAGLRAGLLFNTFPTMGGVWVSPLVGELAPWWRDLVENPATVQLLHRWNAVLVVLAAAALAWASWRVPSARRAALVLGAAAVLQFNLGVFTLLYFHEWPVLLGSLHQLGAVALLVAAVGVAFRLSERVPRRPG
jgi:cytochrome c oxidase assembly protein subunit 15